MKLPLDHAGVRRNAAGALIALFAAACSSRDDRSITLFSAGALAKPLGVALDSFARTRHLTARVEAAGSLETVRKITELGATPDLVALADTALFSSFLADRVGAVTVLGRSRMVLAYTNQSRRAAEIDSSNWTRILRDSAIETGRSDPSLDPAGYRAVMVFELAEKRYSIPGLAASLLAASARNVRPKSADLVALLQTGNLDYAWEYETVARAAHLRYLRLPPEIDLGDSAFAAGYAEVGVRVRSGTGGAGDSVTVRGAPVVFGIATLRSSIRRVDADAFITFLLSGRGRAVTGAAGLEGVLPVR